MKYPKIIRVVTYRGEIKPYRDTTTFKVVASGFNNKLLIPFYTNTVSYPDVEIIYPADNFTKSYCFRMFSLYYFGQATTPIATNQVAGMRWIFYA